MRRRLLVLVPITLSLLLPIAGTALAKDHAYVGARKCKTCHAKKAIGNQYGTWTKSRHAKAFESLGTEKAKKWAAERDIADPQQDERCFKCHVTAHGVPDELVPTSFNRAHTAATSEWMPGRRYAPNSTTNTANSHQIDHRSVGLSRTGPCPTTARIVPMNAMATSRSERLIRSSTPAT